MLSDLVVGYLFLGGTGAGMCLVLSLLSLMVPRESMLGASGTFDGVAASYRTLFVPGYVMSFVLLCLGILCLLADAGGVDRALLLFIRPTLSFLTVGAWALGVCLLLSMTLALMWQSCRMRKMGAMRAVQGCAALAALITATYTGLLLYSLPAVPLWASWWLPLLFVLSAVSCGFAGVLGVAQFTGASHCFTTTLRRLAAADAVVVVLEIVVLLVMTLGALVAPGGALTATDSAASASVVMLLNGEQAWLFWSGFVLLGLVVPLVLDVLLARSCRSLPGVAVVAAASVLAGGFIMRFCIVQAGMHPLLAFGG